MSAAEKMKSYTNIRAPLHMTINIIGNCNLDCVYCYEQPFNKKLIPYEKVITLLEEMREIGVFVIKIAGGEPLLHPKIIDIVNYLVDQHYHAAILTNLAVKPVIVKNIAQILKGIDWINFQVSLDSVDERINDSVRGETATVKSNIDLLIDTDLDFQIAAVVTNKNIDIALDIIDHYTPKVKRFHFMNLMPTVKLPHGGGFEDYIPNPITLAEFWQRVSEKKAILGEKVVFSSEISGGNTHQQECQYAGCTAGITFCEIDSNLDVLACNIAKPYVLGNISDTSFHNVWNSEQATRIRSIETALCKTRGQVNRFLNDPRTIPLTPAL